MREDGSAEVVWLARRAGHVSKSVKGLLIGLAAVLGPELTQDAGAAALALAGTVIAALLGNMYGDGIQHEIQLGRRLDRRALATVVWRCAAAAVAGGPPAAPSTLPGLDRLDPPSRRLANPMQWISRSRTSIRGHRA